MKKITKIFIVIAVIIAVYVIGKLIYFSSIEYEAVIINSYDTIQYKGKFYDYTTHIPESADEIASFDAKYEEDYAFESYYFTNICTLYIAPDGTEYIFLITDCNLKESPFLDYKEREE